MFSAAQCRRSSSFRQAAGARGVYADVPDAGADASAFYAPVSNDRPFITPERTPRQPEPPPKPGRGVHADVPNTRSSGSTADANALSTASIGETGAGEFTRMFQTPASPSATATGQAAEPGEFTRFFQAPQQASSTPAAHPAYKDPFAKARNPPPLRAAWVSLRECSGLLS